MSHILKSLFCCLLAVVMTACGTTQRPRLPQTVMPQNEEEREEAYSQIERLAEVMLHIKKAYVEEKEYDEIINGALEGMLNSLDEHSHFLPPRDLQVMGEETSGTFGGIGIYIGIRDEIPTVIAPIEDTPGFRAGLMAKDRIIKIDGEKTIGKKTSAIVKELRGEPGTDVTIEVLRASEQETLTFTLTREEIKVPSVKGTRIIGDGVGYIRITQFSRSTADSLQEALDELTGKEMNALVLDLRDNPGGLLTSAIDVAEKFLERDTLVVSIYARDPENNRDLFAEGDTHVKVPMAILINGGSASASEIVSGALKDHKRAILVGEKSFGKGSVQSIVPLQTDETSGIRLTTSKYYTPSKREIHKHGIEPDVAVPVSLADWVKIRIRRAHLELPDSYTEKDKADYATVVDPQLERAMDLLDAIKIFKSHEEGVNRQVPAIEKGL